MKLIWTKSSLPLSKFIRWGLNEESSHFAIVFDGDEENTKGIVFESNLSGSHIKWYPTFLKHCEVVHTINIAMPLKKEEAVYQAILNRYDDKSYDYKAFAYFTYRALLFKIFKKPMPNKNAWGTSDTFICVGLAQALRDEANSLPIALSQVVKDIEDLEMISPEQLFLRIQEAMK